MNANHNIERKVDKICGEFWENSELVGKTATTGSRKAVPKCYNNLREKILYCRDQMVNCPRLTDLTGLAKALQTPLHL
jgi:hypothetical protein